MHRCSYPFKNCLHTSGSASRARESNQSTHYGTCLLSVAYHSATATNGAKLALWRQSALGGGAN
eukprot:COSAG02_NODE_43734_length_372_cov_0.754579_1_plen_63_part_01